MNIKIDHDSTIPLHVQLLNELRHLILSGKAEPGSRLPSESEFQRGLEISRSTIRQALNNAETEGLIERVPGKGSFVRLTPMEQSTKNKLIGYITFDFHSEFQGQLLSGAESVIRKNGYRMLFCNSNGNVDEEDKLLDQLVSDKVLGILMWPAYSSNTSRRLFQLADQQQVPIVLMDRTFEELNNDYIISDNFKGAYEAVNYLISLGHTQIVFLSRPILKLLPIAERLRGYRQAMIDNGLRPLDPWIVGAAEKESGYSLQLNGTVNREIEQIEDMLKSKNRPTAIFSMNDLMALEVSKAAKLVGLTIPSDISIIGFDDMDIVSYFDIPLTTVHQDTYYMGRRAAELLVERTKGYSGPPRREIIPTYLRMRASVFKV